MATTWSCPEMGDVPELMASSYGDNGAEASGLV